MNDRKVHYDIYFNDDEIDFYDDFGSMLIPLPIIEKAYKAALERKKKLEKK